MAADQLRSDIEPSVTREVLRRLARGMHGYRRAPLSPRQAPQENDMNRITFSNRGYVTHVCYNESSDLLLAIESAAAQQSNKWDRVTAICDASTKTMSRSEFERARGLHMTTRTLYVLPNVTAESTAEEQTT